MNTPQMSNDLLPAIASQELSRRGLLRVGGMTVALAALVAACGDNATDHNPARIGESLQPRLEGQPQHIVATAWKAQVRLCGRFVACGHAVATVWQV